MIKKPKNKRERKTEWKPKEDKWCPTILSLIPHWPMPSLSPSYDWLPFPVTSPVYMLGMEFCGVEYSFGSSGQLSWTCSIPASCAFPYWQSMGKCKVLDSGQALFSNNANIIAVLCTLFATKSKTHHWTSTRCWTKKKLIPSQTKPGQHIQMKILFMFFFMFFTFCILVVTDEKDFPDYLPAVTLQALKRPSAIPLYWLFISLIQAG